MATLRVGLRPSVRPSIRPARQLYSVSHGCVVWLCRMLCDTRDTSILIVDTYVTIPISPKSRYTPVYRSSEKYRETAQVSRVSTIPRVSYHWTTSSLQAKTNVIKSLTVKHCASSNHSLSHPVLLHSLGSNVIIYQWRTDYSWTKNQDSNFKDFCRLEM